MAELKSYNGYYLWQYIPNTAAAALFTALFALGTAVVVWRMIRSRAWFCTVFIIGAILEIGGYAARAVSKNKTDELIPYVIQSTFILVAPALFAASVYMSLGRIIRSIGAESLSIIPVKWLTKIFVCGDVISFMVQASGAGIQVKADSAQTGENIILAGLFIQIIIFGFFAVTAAIFHVRVHRHRPRASLEHGTKWEKLMTMLYIVSVLIMVRSIFRVVEYIMGRDGYPLSHEWTLYVFDAVLMFGVVVLFAWRFPSDLNPFKLDQENIEISGQVRQRGVIAQHK
ncbi:RTA1 like protein-domain-containing protein [Emericellopsis atlantica]|uniref:RTA1 like protein-domain-containing protein n=1 Tax=Emericellopsis atlantica TaxID=2614577 RepID=A0A9P7ZI64_9HYPO|nr:RTA1 like protein-domain-containing protein [Emericellopsis atlantica]KAG9252371.1 RTA1 like protein-domain-containing protein [Emericellopsis atlantica]